MLSVGEALHLVSVYSRSKLRAYQHLLNALIETYAQAMILL